MRGSKIELKPDETKTICNLYLQGLTLYEVELQTGFSSHAVYKSIYAAGILRTAAESAHLRVKRGLTQQRCVGTKNPSWKGGRGYNKNTGYNWVYVPSNSPYSKMAHGNRVPEHRLIVAQHLGRCLEPWEIVHHKNGNRTDNRIENLQLVAREGHNRSYSDGYKQALKDNQLRFETLEKRVTLLEAENELLRHHSGLQWDEDIIILIKAEEEK